MRTEQMSAARDDSDEDKQMQEAIRSRANYSLAVLEKTLFQRFGRHVGPHGRWLMLSPKD